MMGVNTTAYKVAAFALAAALTGLAGGIFSQWNVFINQDNTFPIEYNVQMILISLLGGTGTVFRPSAGAVLLQLLIQFLGGTQPISFHFLFRNGEMAPHRRAGQPLAPWGRGRDLQMLPRRDRLLRRLQPY